MAKRLLGILAGGSIVVGSAIYAAVYFLSSSSTADNEAKDVPNKPNSDKPTVSIPDRNDVKPHITFEQLDIAANASQNNPYGFSIGSSAKEYFDELDVGQENDDQQSNSGLDLSKNRSQTLLDKVSVSAKVYRRKDEHKGDAVLLKLEWASQNKDKTQGLLVNTVVSNVLGTNAHRAVHRFVYMSKKDSGWVIDNGFEVEEEISASGLSIELKGEKKGSDDEYKFSIDRWCDGSVGSSSCSQLPQGKVEWEVKSWNGIWMAGEPLTTEMAFDEAATKDYKNKNPHTLSDGLLIVKGPNYSGTNGLLFWVEPFKLQDGTSRKTNRYYDSTSRKWVKAEGSVDIDFRFPYVNDDLGTDNQHPLSAYGKWSWTRSIDNQS